MWAYTDLPMMALFLATIAGDIDTDGGGVVGGGAHVGRDYTGRDQHPVNVYTGPHGNDDQHTTRRANNDSERISNLEHDVYGRADYWPGVIRRQNKLIEDLSVLRRQFQTILFWQYFLMAVIALMVVLGIINLIVLRLPLL